ncbi:hypothetical protein GCM10025734_76500 [Kitasatospora paranensis]
MAGTDTGPLAGRPTGASAARTPDGRAGPGAAPEPAPSARWNATAPSSTVASIAAATAGPRRWRPARRPSTAGTGGTACWAGRTESGGGAGA